MSAHTDFPFLHIPKTGNEAYKGRFAGAGRPDNGDDLPLLHMQGDIFQDLQAAEPLTQVVDGEQLFHRNVPSFLTAGELHRFRGSWGFRLWRAGTTLV